MLVTTRKEGDIRPHMFVDGKSGLLVSHERGSLMAQKSHGTNRRRPKWLSCLDNP